MARLVTRFAKHYTARIISSTHKDFLPDGIAARTFLSSVRTITTSPCTRADRYYTDKHEWVTVNGKIGTVGISDYAQDALGDVVYAQLPNVDTVIKKDEECGALESVKAASELISPVSGTVREKNDAVETKPSLINSSCYDEGWLFKIELSAPDEIKQLMNEEAYNTYLKTASQ